jgi:hypothetical protein
MAEADQPASLRQTLSTGFKHHPMKTGWNSSEPRCSWSWASGCSLWASSSSTPSSRRGEGHTRDPRADTELGCCTLSLPMMPTTQRHALPRVHAARLPEEHEVVRIQVRALLASAPSLDPLALPLGCLEHTASPKRSCAPHARPGVLRGLEVRRAATAARQTIADQAGTERHHWIVRRARSGNWYPIGTRARGHQRPRHHRYRGFAGLSGR